MLGLAGLPCQSLSSNVAVPEAMAISHRHTVDKDNLHARSASLIWMRESSRDSVRKLQQGITEQISRNIRTKNAKVR
jgi:hypothetical protein